MRTVQAPQVPCPHPNFAEVVEAISGNICRCTGYEPIIEAVLAAAQTGGRRRA